MFYQNVAQLHVRNFVIGYPGNHRTEQRRTAGRNDIRNAYSPDGTYRRSGRASHARTEANKDGRSYGIAHGEVRNGYVLDDGPIDAQDSQTKTTVKNAIRDGDVLEAA